MNLVISIPKLRIYVLDQMLYYKLKTVQTGCKSGQALKNFITRKNAQNCYRITV